MGTSFSLRGSVPSASNIREKAQDLKMWLRLEAHVPYFVGSLEESLHSGMNLFVFT